MGHTPEQLVFLLFLVTLVRVLKFMFLSWMTEFQSVAAVLSVLVLQCRNLDMTISSFLSFVLLPEHRDRTKCGGETGIRPGLGLASGLVFLDPKSRYPQQSLEGHHLRSFFQLSGTLLCVPSFPVLPSVCWQACFLAWCSWGWLPTSARSAEL